MDEILTLLQDLDFTVFDLLVELDQIEGLAFDVGLLLNCICEYSGKRAILKFASRHTYVELATRIKLHLKREIVFFCRGRLSR